MPTYRWKVPPLSEGVTSFVLERSSNAGETWSAIATVTADTTDPLVYDAAADRFFYVDGASVSGEIVRIAAVNSEGTSAWSYHYPPPAPARTCNVYGVVLDPASNRPWPGLPVIVEVLTAGNAAQVENSSTPARNRESAVVAARRLSVFTDDSGRWKVDLVVDMPVRVTIPKANLAQAFRVPDLSVLNFRDASRYAIDVAQFGKNLGSGIAAGPLGVGVHVP